MKKLRVDRRLLSIDNLAKVHETISLIDVRECVRNGLIINSCNRTAEFHRLNCLLPCLCSI